MNNIVNIAQCAQQVYCKYGILNSREKYALLWILSTT